jgi:hypothetical protein
MLRAPGLAFLSLSKTEKASGKAADDVGCRLNK